MLPQENIRKNYWLKFISVIEKIISMIEKNISAIGTIISIIVNLKYGCVLRTQRIKKFLLRYISSIPLGLLLGNCN